MPDFQVVEGKLSEKYNTFADYSFDSCDATDTRLMGVVAMQVKWRSNDRPGDRFIQLIHLDYSEYGIDDYEEYVIEESDSTAKHEVRETWKRISGHLGGTEISLPFRAMIWLIDSALSINEAHYRNHPEDIREFRKHTLLRIGVMRGATKDIFERSIFLSPSECMELVCPRTLSRFETINYFLMRMADMDLSAAAYLSQMDEKTLSSSPIAQKGLMTVMRNRIARDKTLETDSDISVYRCRTLYMKDNDYFFGQSTVSLSRTGMLSGMASGAGIGTSSARNPRVMDFEASKLSRISQFEAAALLRQTEYITLFALDRPAEDIDLDRAFIPSSSAMMPVPNGVMYAHYNSDNSHVDTDNYYLNQDLYGAYLLSSQNELVVMSSKLMNITVMETDLMSSALFSDIELKGRYRFDTQIFQTLCELGGAVFEDMIEKPDPDK